eukprot:scaffold24770_cov142-Cylindrotheca_fusiformis.AAC.1
MVETLSTPSTTTTTTTSILVAASIVGLSTVVYYTTTMSFSSLFGGGSSSSSRIGQSQKKQLAERIAARVKERNSWSTWHNHSPKEVFQFLANYKMTLPKLPSQKELDIEFPVQKMDWDLLSSLSNNNNKKKEQDDSKNNKKKSSLAVTWIGHATCLVQLDGYNILTDPVFSKRCAPTQFAGPARYRPTPCTIVELVNHIDLDVVMVSHNHYDHLDYASIQDLARYAKNSIVFVVPLGLKSWMQSNISKIEEKHTVVELDWHETHSVVKKKEEEEGGTGSGDATATAGSSSSSSSSLEITPVPMQHWSSRRGYDRDQTLWCGFSMRSLATDQRALFAGDTGWFEKAHDIGKQYGPYDIAMIPIGAYEPYDFMRPQHNDPKDAVHMMQAVQAKQAIPIHWGTFQLTKEHYLEPRERLEKSMEAAGMEKETFQGRLIGETVLVI